jgi:hypothetical protein
VVNKTDYHPPLATPTIILSPQNTDNNPPSMTLTLNFFLFTVFRLAVFIME